jgi:hypothetical protein
MIPMSFGCHAGLQMTYQCNEDVSQADDPPRSKRRVDGNGAPWGESPVAIADKSPSTSDVGNAVLAGRNPTLR